MPPTPLLRQYIQTRIIAESLTETPNLFLQLYDAGRPA
jgi:hypothetical protein